MLPQGGKSNDRACEVGAITEGNIFRKARTQTVSIVFVNHIFKKKTQFEWFYPEKSGASDIKSPFFNAKFDKKEVITVLFFVLKIANN